jgi:hypothetical protein
MHKKPLRNLQGVNSMNKQSTKENMQKKVDRNKTILIFKNDWKNKKNLLPLENEITFSKWDESCH